MSITLFFLICAAKVKSYLKGSSNFKDSSISKLAVASWLIYLGDFNIDLHRDNQKIRKQVKVLE